MKKAIVTGATGFIGSWLAVDLLQAGYEVTVIVRNPDKLIPEIKNNGNTFLINKDLNDLSVEEFPTKDYDIFIHLGWAGVSSEQKNNIQLQVSNIFAALNALKICNKLQCKLFLSTGTAAEYALTDDVINLNARQCPNNAYGAAKVSVHHFLCAEARKLGQPFIWVVLPNTFGERSTDNSIITYTIKKLLNEQKPIYGNLEQIWDFLYVSEVARALRLIGEKGRPGKIYGIGSGLYRPLKDYIYKIRDMINPQLELGIGEASSLSGQSFSSCVNHYDLMKDIGFYPMVSFEEGIKRTINYWIMLSEIPVLPESHIF